MTIDDGRPARWRGADGRSDKGKRAYFRGVCAEDSAIAHYENLGAVLLEHRWRGTAGEIDLVLREGDTVVFCEVKSSSTFDRARSRLSTMQIRRVYGAASEYLDKLPEGQLAEVRFDVAAIDGSGRVQITRNAFGQD